MEHTFNLASLEGVGGNIDDVLHVSLAGLAAQRIMMCVAADQSNEQKERVTSLHVTGHYDACQWQVRVISMKVCAVQVFQ